jgi:hypothetical protein
LEKRKEIFIQNAKIFRRNEEMQEKLNLGLGLYLHKEVRVKDLGCPEIFRSKSEEEKES